MMLHLKFTILLNTFRLCTVLSKGHWTHPSLGNPSMCKLRMELCNYTRTITYKNIPVSQLKKKKAREFVTYHWGLFGRCPGWWDQSWPRGLAHLKAHACAVSPEKWPYTEQTCRNNDNNNKKASSVFSSPCFLWLQKLDLYLCWSKGYVMNLGSKGMSGRLLQYFTRHTTPDLDIQYIHYLCFLTSHASTTTIVVVVIIVKTKTTTPPQ